ncbi:hypothetical protein [Natrononativus amylolyticus]|uniref:hypothetical protein n=1 Tax=Natrononativus amylolyticus TaxID=2963434 RepID=UPI0020CB9D5A|nr:hypothetical protein [Natrononativus amylolyticus]
MNFDRVIKHSSVDTDKHTVGLTIYFYDELKDEGPVLVQRIKETLNNSRVDVNRNNVSSYPSQLANDGYVKKNGDGYLLTHEGMNYYSDLVDLPEFPEKQRDDDFLTVDYTDERFYNQLIDEINKTYQIRAYNATMVLTRKLFESLLIDILRGHYGNREIRMFFNPDRAQYLPFSVLIENFDEQLQDFRHYSLTLDEDFIKSLNDFRYDANDSAHSIEIDISEEEIEEKSEEGTWISEILFNVWRKVQIANGIGDEDKLEK